MVQDTTIPLSDNTPPAAPALIRSSHDDHGHADAPFAARTFGEGILLAAIAVGFVHHVDHVLRYDHSGWPFRPDATPFTWSLVVYPILLLALVARRRPWLRVGLLALVLVAVQTAHVFVESPRQQYETWATGVSSDPALLGAPNVLHVASPAVGAIAAGVSLALSVLLVTALASFIIEARREAGSMAPEAAS